MIFPSDLVVLRHILRNRQFSMSEPQPGGDEHQESVSALFLRSPSFKSHFLVVQPSHGEQFLICPSSSLELTNIRVITCYSCLLW